MKARTLIVGFVIGALIPLFWGILGFVLFNAPEGLGIVSVLPGYTPHHG